MAAEFFDEALSVIETAYASNQDAQLARHLFVREASKDFRGEPYERAMAYYYRGLLYMRASDYENAGASFKSGVLQDALAEKEEYQADFSLLMLLEGWASHCRGQQSQVQEICAEFKAHNRFRFPPPVDGHNTLILVETGWSPIKIHGEGRQAEEWHALRFRPGGEADSPRLLLPTGHKERYDGGGDANPDRGPVLPGFDPWRTGAQFHSRGQGPVQGGKVMPF
ncbi:MAG: hypothetical protein FD153_1647 [Rhodospirillaceae bacterium]|nr:MAG: hypothetical protein FD153_1647 [Rhodospirillaceae bacterium]